MTPMDVCPEWERQVSQHVAALIELGWKWEGRGLMPQFNAWCVSHVASSDTDNRFQVANETLQRCQQTS